jgi:hypothetical protein
LAKIISHYQPIKETENMARMLGATKSGLCWIIGCVCALCFGRELTAQAAPEYGVRAIQPAVTDEQRKATEQVIDKYLAAAEAERQPIVDELKKQGDGGRIVVQQKMNESQREAITAKEALKKAEAEGKTEEAAKWRADAEKTAAKSAALAKLLTLMAPVVKPKIDPPIGAVARYGIARSQ